MPNNLLGQSPKRKWQTIKAQADTLEAHKDYKAALPLRLQEKDIALKKWKKPSEQYATATYDLGLCYYYLQKIDSSLFFFQESLETREQMKDTNSMSYIKPLVACAKMNILKEDYKNAAPFCENLSQIAPKVFAENDPNYLTILNILGLFYHGTGEVEKALAIFQKGIKLSKPFLDTNPMLYIRFVSNLGKYYYDLGQNHNGIIFYTKALAIMEEKSLVNTNEYLLLTNNLATAYETAGKYKLAMKLLCQYLNGVEKTQGKMNPNYAAGLQNMGQLYYHIQQYDSSLIVLKEARTILKNIYTNNRLDDAAIQTLIAQNYIDMGKLAEGLALINKSLKVFEEINTQNIYYVSTQDLVANSYLKMGKYNEALVTAKKGLAVKKEVLGENLDYARGLSNMSIIYRELTEYDTALIYLRNALEMYDKMGGTFYHYGNIYINFANVFRHTHQLDSALLYAQRCIAINEKEDIVNNLKNYSEGLSLLAAIYQDKHHFSLAADYLTQNNKLLYQHYQRQSASLSEKDRKELWSTLQSDYESLQYLCFVAKDSVPQLITKAYNNQLNTGGILLRGTENIAQAIRKNGDEKLIILYNDWLYKKNQVIDWATWDSTQRKLAAIDLKLETDKANEMEQQLAQQSLIFRNAIDTISVEWQQVQAALQKGEAAVEIVQFRKKGKVGLTDTIHYAAFILTPETKTVPIYVPLPFGNKMEGEWATEYQNHIEDSVNTLSFSRYFQPILAHIKDAKHIYFAADGVYHKLNLNTLLDEDGKYLVEKYTIHHIASTRDLATRKATETFPENATAVLFGNPACKISEKEHESLTVGFQKSIASTSSIYSSHTEGRDEFNDLPAAKAEVIAIGNLLQKHHFQVKTYLEKQALEEEVQNLKHPSIVHFATHGGFNEDTIQFKEKDYYFYENPMYKSMLYFVGAENTALSLSDSTQTKHEDGILYAAEAALLDLQGTDLVALSACETGLGTIQNGEGVWGLQRAFRIAGAKNLMMSLWAVNDKSSEEFMTTFFENWLEKKMPKYAAFQQAQLSLMEEYKNEPKKWGGFILLEGL